MTYEKELAPDTDTVTTTTSEYMELTIIKVPPNSKATEITLMMKVEHKWEING